MSDPKQKHGNHTWDLVLHYHRCKHCGYINENREKFQKKFNLLQKTVLCTKCSQSFTVTKHQYLHDCLLGYDPNINE